MTTHPQTSRPPVDPDLYAALSGPSRPHLPTEPDYYELIPEALRCLRLLDDALSQMPNPNDRPARRHLDWAYTSRQRAQQALIVLPQDRTAPTTPPPGAFHLGPRPVTGDALRDTLLPNQTRLSALHDDLGPALDQCEDARCTATTVRDLVRCLTTYIAEIEMGDAWGYLGQTVDNPFPDITAKQFNAFLATLADHSGDPTSGMYRRTEPNSPDSDAGAVNLPSPDQDQQ